MGGSEHTVVFVLLVQYLPGQMVYAQTNTVYINAISHASLRCLILLYSGRPPINSCTQQSSHPAILTPCHPPPSHPATHLDNVTIGQGLQQGS